MRSGLLVCVLSAATLLPASASAIGLLGFDSADTLDPARFEVGGGAAFGTDVLNVYGIGRFGVLPDLELGVRGGLSFLSEADDSGFELEGVAKFRFLRQEDTGDIVTLSAMGAAAILNTSDVFILAVDPSLLASHEFRFAPGQSVFVSAGLGLAVSFIDNDGETETNFGLLGTVAAGVDVIPNVRLGLEARLRDISTERDALRRLGIGVTCLF